MILGNNGDKKVISSIISKRPKINKVTLYYREKATRIKSTQYPTNITLTKVEKGKQFIQLAKHPYFANTLEITSSTPRYFREVIVKSGNKVIGYGNIWKLSNQDCGIKINVKDRTIGDNPWVIEINKQDNPPLEDLQIKVFGDQLCVRFFQSEELLLGYGVKRGTNAAYDLALTLNKKMPAKPTHTLGKEIRNLGKKPTYIDVSQKTFSIVFYTFFLVFIPLFIYFFIKYKLNKKKKKYKQVNNRIIIEEDDKEDDSW
jgi:cbb3-type cytochrome oxidase subunit 3